MDSMLTMDVFKQDAFSAITLIEAVEAVPFKPKFLTSLGLFDDQPVRTISVAVERRDGVLNLIQTTPRGAPLSQRTTEKRVVRNLNTVRIAKQDRMMADEIQGVRAFGSTTELQTLQNEIMRRLAGPAGLMREVEMTWEFHALNAVQGILLDADGSTIYNLFTEFGVSQPAEVAMDFDGANALSSGYAPGLLRAFIMAQIVRPMLQAAKMGDDPSVEIWALCGHAFYDKITNHGETRQSYLAQVEAKDLRKGNAFEVFNFAGINWVDYRGTDDSDATVGVNTDKAKFFLRGAPGLFKRGLAPAEFFNTVNTLGRPLYPLIVVDKDRQAWADIELYSYPLYICTRPETLFRARRGA